MNSIKTKAFKSALWKFMERILAQGISLIVSVIIARILDPSDYTVVGVVTIFFSFANIIISGGLNTALIQKKDVDSDDYSSVLIFSTILSFIIYIILFIFAPLISDIYHQPLLIPVIRVMCIILPISAIKSIWCAYISSNLEFKKFFFATLGGTLFSAIVGISMALKGFGAWALVAQQMSNTIIDTIILILTTRIGIKLRFSIIKFRKLFSYSWKVLASSILGTVYTELTPLIIGIKYSGTDLSYYTKGRSFPYLISNTTTNTLSAVLFPVLSKYQDNKEKLLKYTRIYIRLASFISFPIMLGFFVVSDNFVSVILTDKWLPAAPYIRIFCIASMFDMIHIGNCETIKAMGRSDIYLLMEIIKKIMYFLTIALFVIFSKSAEWMAFSFIICTFIAIVVNSIPNRRLIGYRYIDQISDIIPNLIISILMCIPTTIVGKTIGNGLLILVTQIFTGLFIYICLAILTKNVAFIYLFDLIKHTNLQNNSSGGVNGQ